MKKKKFCLLVWDKIFVSLKCGGLGIRRIRDVNISFLCKWLWEFGIGGDCLWKRIIWEKYGS